MILLHLSYSRYKEMAADRIGHCYFFLPCAKISELGVKFANVLNAVNECSIKGMKLYLCKGDREICRN